MIAWIAMVLLPRMGWSQVTVGGRVDAGVGLGTGLCYLATLMRPAGHPRDVHTAMDVPLVQRLLLVLGGGFLARPRLG
jgi:hypothetical protein